MSKDKIQDYTITQAFTNQNSGFAKWGFAERAGHDYFIKEFLSPIYPDENSPLSSEQRQKKIDECNDWVNKKSELYETIRKTSNGNIIVPHDFFRDGSHYYLVTDKVDTSTLSVSDVSVLDIGQKLIILKVFSHCMYQLGKYNVVHSDLKPENLLIKETVSGMYTLKLIDFDSSYLENQLPLPDEIQCDPTYMAPEVFLYMIEENDIVTHTADVFSAGLIFHQYLCGELPSISDDYDYIYEAVLDDAEIVLNDSIPPRLKAIISMMLEKEPSARLNSEYVYHLMSLTTLQNIYRISASVEDSRETAVTTETPDSNEKESLAPKKNVFYPASDDEW